MNLAEFSDTTSFSPCKGCSELLQEDDRFCRYCGQDQFADADPASGPARSASNRPGTRSRIEVDFSDTLQPGEDVAVGHPVPTNAANEALNLEFPPARLDAFGPELHAAASPGRVSGRFGTTHRLGLLALVVLLGLALGPDLFLGKQRDESPLPESRAKVEPTPNSLVRADLSDAQRALDERDAVRRTDPVVPKSREALDRRAPVRADAAHQVQTVALDAPRDIGREVSEALGLGGPAAPPAHGPAPPAASAVPSPTAEVGVATPDPKECNEVLAALAVCPKQ